MNKKIFFAGALAVAMTACEYNDEYFEGLDEMVKKETVETVEYTLQDSEYTNKKGYFNTKEEAIPVVTSFVAKNYYTLDNGSAVKVTMNIALQQSEMLTKLNSASSYTLSNEDYEGIWGDVPALYISDSKTGEVAKILANKYSNATSGDYVVVTYKHSTYEPNPADDEVSSVFTKTSEVAEGDYVIAACVNDSYYAFGQFADASKTYGYFASDEFTINKGELLGETLSNYIVTLKKTDKGYSIARKSDGKLVYLSGTYNSFNVAAAPESGADFTITPDAKGVLTIMNVEKEKYVKYDSSYSSYGCYATDKFEGKANFIDSELFKVETKVVSAASKAKTETLYVLYKFDGKAWNTSTDAIVLTADDYKAMGQKYSNLSSTALPANYLPSYLANTFAYPVEGDSKTIAYFFYNSSSKNTYVNADKYEYTNGAWVLPATTEVVKMQFVKASGNWNYDPSVVLTLAADKSTTNVSIYQTMVDWTRDNVKDGANYVTSYKNNDYYSGASAYQTNFDWRASKAKEQYADGYAGMSDEDIVKAMMEHTIEVINGVLPILYPDADLVEGVDVTYTINFVVYTGSSENWTIKFKVVGKGQFEYIEGSLQKVA